MELSASSGATRSESVVSTGSITSGAGCFFCLFFVLLVVVLSWSKRHRSGFRLVSFGLLLLAHIITTCGSSNWMGVRCTGPFIVRRVRSVTRLLNRLLFFRFAFTAGGSTFTASGIGILGGLFGWSRGSGLLGASHLRKELAVALRLFVQFDEKAISLSSAENLFDGFALVTRAHHGFHVLICDL